MVLTVCPSGETGVPVDGGQEIITITSAVASSLLTAKLNWISSLIVGLSFGSITLDLTTFCAVDPPDEPEISGAELASLIALGPGPLTREPAAKVEQMVRRYAWYTFCKCSASGVLTKPEGYDAPTGVPAVNPGPLDYPTAVPCAEQTTTPVTIDSFGSHFGGFVVGQTLATTAITMEVTSIPQGPDAPYFTAALDQYDADDAFMFRNSIELAPGESGVVTAVILPGCQSVGMNFDGDGSGAADEVTWNFCPVKCWCGGTTPFGQEKPCCPPDLIQASKLDAILSLVTLLQRQLAPFAYISGTTHSGLTGTGSFSVQGLIGVLLNVSVPARAGVEIGTPDTVFDCGWINFGTADGWSANRAIRTDSQVVFPEVAGLYVNLGYTLLEGVSMTVTELVREA